MEVEVSRGRPGGETMGGKKEAAPTHTRSAHPVCVTILGPELVSFRTDVQVCLDIMRSMQE